MDNRSSDEKTDAILHFMSDCAASCEKHDLTENLLRTALVKLLDISMDQTKCPLVHPDREFVFPTHNRWVDIVLRPKKVSE